MAGDAIAPAIIPKNNLRLIFIGLIPFLVAYHEGQDSNSPSWGSICPYPFVDCFWVSTYLGRELFYMAIFAV